MVATIQFCKLDWYFSRKLNREVLFGSKWAGVFCILSNIRHRHDGRSRTSKSVYSLSLLFRQRPLNDESNDNISGTSYVRERFEFSMIYLAF